MMASADPTTYIRVKTNNSLITGKSAGNYVFAYPCLQVDDLQWIKEEAGRKCYDGIPVKYAIKGSDRVHRGFFNFHGETQQNRDPGQGWSL